MLAFDAILVYLVIIFIIVSLYFEILGAGFTFLIGVMVLGLFGVLTPKEMLVGASNEQIAIIIMLLLIGGIYQRTSLLNNLFDRFFRQAKTSKGFLTRVMMLIGPLSAFMNNTPLVALMMPYAYDWSKRKEKPISKILIPLSYASILGGCTTLIGTSTNMIVNGMVIESGMPSFRIFDFSLVGIPAMIAGFLYLYFFGQKLLPKKYITSQKANKNTREYIVEVEITPNSQMVGKTIEEANLRNLKGLFLSEIIRNGREIHAISNDTILIQNDILMFAGQTDSIAELLELHKNLRMPAVGMFAKKKYLDFIEIVLPENSRLINKTLKTENFRAKYDSTVIGIHRNGVKLTGKIGAIKLKAGDTLLLLSGDKFNQLSVDTNDFIIISKVKEIRKLTSLQSWILVVGTISAIFLSAVTSLNLFYALVLLLSILLITKITTTQELQKNIDYNLAFIIAMALALGIAMTKTGVAEILANFFIDIFEPWGRLGIMIGLYIITSLLAAFINNKASVAILFPITMNISSSLNVDYIPFVLLITFASAANFMTPVGYQTNTMIYGPGGYSFKDFVRVGFPLTVIYGIVTITILELFYF